ncbi:MerR family transcriptional regulator [Streptococcus merionis]|uniref:MerR family transcriptional regulator n=1 Tax=Streptococcus merionis TaxID=400065 RepID=UPI0026EFADD7|nr:MerR family transcriptional regulator [Streptococcus merionis]
MVRESLFSIGRAADMSGVSTKTLRYYESLDLIHPKHVSEDSGYRYYDKETLLLIPIIKYYQQIGLNLKRIKELVTGAGCSNNYHYLKKRQEELKAERDELLVALASVDDWLQLIIEGEMCLQNQVKETFSGSVPMINLKYYPEEKSYFQNKQSYTYNHKESIINLEWTKFLSDRGLEVSGPVILKYDSYEEKRSGNSHQVTILQHCFPESLDFITFGGFMALSCYHIGSLDLIHTTYQKMIQYSQENNYLLMDECYERHVIDYWVTQNLEEFVTEIIIPIASK